MAKLIDNPNYNIIEIWAVKDRKGNFLGFSNIKEDAYEWFTNFSEVTSISNGFGIIDIESGLVPKNTEEFYYTYQEAFEEMNKEY